MDAVLFELASGGGVAIDADEISSIWEGEEPNTTAIERVGSEVVVVAGHWLEIVSTLYDNRDMRPKKKKKTKEIELHGETVGAVYSIVDYRLLKKK